MQEVRHGLHCYVDEAGEDATACDCYIMLVWSCWACGKLWQVRRSGLRPPEGCRRSSEINSDLFHAAIKRNVCVVANFWKYKYMQCIKVTQIKYSGNYDASGEIPWRCKVSAIERLPELLQVVRTMKYFVNM